MQTDREWIRYISINLQTFKEENEDLHLFEKVFRHQEEFVFV